MHSSASPPLFFSLSLCLRELTHTHILGQSKSQRQLPLSLSSRRRRRMLWSAQGLEETCYELLLLLLRLTRKREWKWETPAFDVVTAGELWPGAKAI